MTPTPHQHRARLRWITSILTGTLMVPAAGCTPAPAGEPANPTTTSSIMPLPSSRPYVSRPLDASAYRDKPCDLFTDEQARVIGHLEPGRSHTEAGLADCLRFSDSAERDEITISYYFGTDLLGRIYRRETNWPTTRWTIPITVARQPGVRTTESTESCRLAFALTDTQGIELHVEYKKADACDRAVLIAENIVHNLEA